MLQIDNMAAFRTRHSVEHPPNVPETVAQLTHSSRPVQTPEIASSLLAIDESAVSILTMVAKCDTGSDHGGAPMFSLVVAPFIGHAGSLVLRDCRTR